MNALDFDSAVETLNKLLITKQPSIFNSSWIRRYAPHVYRFFQKNIRREIGGIDWDRITRALDRRFQRQWVRYRHNRTRLYRSKAEVNIILRKYDDKLYTFLRGGRVCLDSLKQFLSDKLLCLMPLPSGVVYCSKHHLGSFGQDSDADAGGCRIQSIP